MKPDLDQIYSELDLRPNCSLEEFKHAYRRRIAMLHPDRPGGRPGSPENRATLSDLIWVYATVTRFHRRYGRMPGGNTPRTSSGKLPIFLGQDRGHSSPGSDDAQSRNRRRARATVTLVALFIALVALLASWSWLTSGGRRLNDTSAGQATSTWAAIGGSILRMHGR